MPTPSETSTSDSRSLSVAFLNINGFRHKTNDIRQIISENELHVLALCETKLDTSVKDNKVFTPGFRMWRKDRTNNRGGVALYVQDHIETTLRSDLMKTEAEIIWVEMKLPDNRPVLVGSCYRPPNDDGNYLIELYKIMTLVSKENLAKDILLMGDFNINWTAQDSLLKNFAVRFSSEWGLTQIVTDDTKFAKNSSSCIDHIYTNIPKMCQDVRSTMSGCSDHNLITAKVRINIPEKKIWYRSDEEFDEVSFIRDIKKAQWTKMYEESDPLSTFTDIFLSIADKHSKPWIINIYDYLTLETKLRSQRVEAAQDHPEKLLKIFQEVLGESLPSYVINITKEGNDPKHLHQTKTMTEERVPDDDQLQNNSQISKSFSFSITDAETVKRWLIYFCDHVTGEIYKTELKLLKLAADEIYVHICHILNGFIRNQVFPSELINPKTALMSGNKCTFFRENCKHGVYTMLGLIFDVILRDQTIEHFINDLIPLTRDDKISKIQSDWIKTTENVSKTVIVYSYFLDFSSLFHSIRHELLLNILREYGFSDSAARLIKSFFSNHKGSCGLPQRGLLAQVLFYIFLNDLSSIFKRPFTVLSENNFMMFYTGKNTTTLNYKSKSVLNWAKEKKICLNETELVATKDSTEIIFNLLRSVLDFDKLFQLNWIQVLKVVMQNHGSSWENKYYSVLKDLESHFDKTCLDDIPEEVKDKVINFLVQDQFGKPPPP